ncbi:PP2C family protein-serine/threonine phosphatase [Paracoccus methylarcula]|uniref:Fused response regulator/phosphatase n=1 Tax=Paracoccus methylarcula TaxID=72022 RepID=A0A422R067_9RHOB|nr:fused response regulator/phosphatase [Paracoccus methylarcula]RNF35626.1 fused response regulator/phosphatase [Paracoccus methylarcula]
MTRADRPLPPTTTGRHPGRRASQVLIIGDLAEQCRDLARAGYDVEATGSAVEALAICQRRKPDFIIADWSMPDMSGVEFCRAFRNIDQGGDGHVILLAHHQGAAEIATGLDAGMNDFLTTPVKGPELQARLLIGSRNLRIGDALRQENTRLHNLLQQLQEMRASAERDLRDAGRLQQAMMRGHAGQFGKAAISLLLHPARAVGGDLVGCFSIDDHRIGIFALDIAGHGVAAALVAARLSAHLSENPDLNEVLRPTRDGGDPLTPAALAHRLNRLLLEERGFDSYLTLIYADLDHANGHVRMVQAGHPHPVLQTAHGSLRQLGKGGMPVGLFPEPIFDEFELTMRPGERMLIASDGITESNDPGGGYRMQSRLEDLLTAHSGLHGHAFLEAMLLALDRDGADRIRDDRSAVLVEFGPPPSARPAGTRSQSDQDGVEDVW